MGDHLASSHVNVHETHHYPVHHPPPPPPHEAQPVAFLPKQYPLENGLPYRHDTSGAHTHFPDDVVLYVGKSRQTFHVNAQTLITGSAYFKNLLLQYAHPPLSQACGYGIPNGGHALPSIVIDCEDGTFESLLLLMRYGTVEALPPMSAAEIYRVKKEAEFYGIHFTEPPSSKGRATTESGDSLSDKSSVRSQLSSPSGSPKSTMNMSPGPVADQVAGGHRHYEDVRLACKTAGHLTELPKFPVELLNPARLVLVSCLDQHKASSYACDCAAFSSRKLPESRNTQWAVNFHHRHAFCTSCGHPPNMSPKHFSEMLMAAAAHCAPTSPGQSASHCAWRVSCDSTCMLRFISNSGDGHDACGCSAGRARDTKEARPTVWAANCFYSHAFCTCCGETAKGPVLLSLILALRYGGSTFKVSTPGCR